jgi:hypothetical protein
MLLPHAPSRLGDDNHQEYILIVLDDSGQNQVCIWTGQDWMTVTNQPTHQCDVYAVSGPFMVCTYNADLQLHEGILYEITCGLSD